MKKSPKAILMIKEADSLNFQIRAAVKENVVGQNAEEFADIISDAISRGEEHLLPGLGVLLEGWWQNTNEEERQEFTKELAQAFKAN